MSLRNLPKPKAFERPARYSWDAAAEALTHWAERPLAADDGDATTISIFDVIGEDPWTGEGFTAKKLGAILRKMGAQPVTVRINSPGGDMFEGLTIYNLLRDYPAEVTVKVLGVAASAASLIAMAGDQILMGQGAIMMIHNAWGLVIGNRHDFADAAKVFETFDQSMAEIYASRTGLPVDEIFKLLDGPDRASDGTYMAAQEAIDKGFADGVLDGEEPAGRARNAIPADVIARRRLEAALARQGMGRKERFELINSLSGPRDATRPAARDAGDLNAALMRLLSAIKS